MIAFQEMIQQARAGDPEAISRVYDEYVAPMLVVIRRRMGQGLRRHYDSLDLAHSAFADILRDLPRFEDRGEDAFRHWLFMRAQSKVWDKMRRVFGRDGSRRAVTTGGRIRELPAGPPPDAITLRREEEALARERLATLDRDSARLVHLRLSEGLRFAQIAERLGLPSADAARKRYARSLLRIRKP